MVANSRGRWDVIVIGGGAAGLFAATVASQRGRRVLLIEKNPQLGVKILMSGGTRCNITHDCTWRELAERFEPAARRFLKPALAALTPQMVMDIVEAEGVPTKVESTGKVFPVSNRAVDVRDALQRRAVQAGVVFQLGCSVVNIRRDEAEFVCQCRVTGEPDDIDFASESLIITSGGQSYPGCGTTGDGYAWAAAFGHKVQPLKPALTPLITETAWVRALRGVTVESCRVRLFCENNKKPIAEERSSLLFTHFGLSGPAAMNISRFVATVTAEPRPYLEIDWVPGSDQDHLFAAFATRRIRDGKRQVIGTSPTEMPQRLWQTLCELVELSPETRWAELPRSQERKLVEMLKGSRVVLHGTMGYRKAEVTAGGVALDEVNPRNMESLRVPRLFFAGEILDIDGPIGGFNFQAAFSTGALAGQFA